MPTTILYSQTFEDGGNIFDNYKWWNSWVAGESTAPNNISLGNMNDAGLGGSTWGIRPVPVTGETYLNYEPEAIVILEGWATEADPVVASTGVTAATKGAGTIEWTMDFTDLDRDEDSYFGIELHRVGQHLSVIGDPAVELWYDSDGVFYLWVTPDIEWPNTTGFQEFTYAYAVPSPTSTAVDFKLEWVASTGIVWGNYSTTDANNDWANLCPGNGALRFYINNVLVIDTAAARVNLDPIKTTGSGLSWVYEQGTGVARLGAVTIHAIGKFDNLLIYEQSGTTPDISINIGGEEKVDFVDRFTVRITKDDHVERCTFTTFSRDLTSTAYRPTLGMTVHVTQEGQLLFGGTVEEVRDHATDDLNHGATMVDVTCLGYHVLPGQLLVTTSYGAGAGVLDVAGDLCAMLTTYFGVVNIALTGGTALPAIAWDHVTVEAALIEICRITGYIWRINGDKWFTCQVPGTDVGQTFTNANSTVIRSFGWGKSRVKQATRVWTKIGATGTGATAYTQTWTGDGTRKNFYLNVSPTWAPETVSEDGTPVAVPSATWTYDATRTRLVRATALGNGVVLSCTTTVYFPAYCRAETEASVDAGNLVEKVFEYPNVTELDQGIALAAGHLSQQASAPKRLVIQTRTINVYPLQTCTCTFTDRLISGDYLVRRVIISPDPQRGTGSKCLLYEVELWETTVLGGSWLDWWREQKVSLIGGVAQTPISPSVSASRSVSKSPSASISKSPSVSASKSPSVSPSVSASASPSVSASVSDSASPSVSPSST